MNSSSGLWQAVVPVIDALEALPARYYIGGSVASSFTGIARFTQDADLIADLRPAHLETLATTLEGTYIVLQKLRWFTEGGGVSERQWYDLQGVLRLQRQALDLGYLRKWAEQLGLAELVERAFDEAGLGG